MVPEPSLKTVKNASLMVAPWCEQGYSGAPVVPGASLKTVEQTSVMVAPWRRSLCRRLTRQRRGAGAFVEDCQASFANGGTVAETVVPEASSKTVTQASLMMAPRRAQGYSGRGVGLC